MKLPKTFVPKKDLEENIQRYIDGKVYSFPELKDYEREETTFEGYDQQVFPKSIKKITKALEEVRFCAFTLDDIFLDIECYESRRGGIETEDSYSWFWSLYFETQKGVVALLVP